MQDTKSSLVPELSLPVCRGLSARIRGRFFYDDDTAEYIRSVIKPCNKKYQAAVLKRHDAKKVPVKMKSQEPAKDKVLKEEFKPAASKKKVVTSHKARPNPAVTGFEYRFQQIQVLGSLLNEQISQLSRDMAASRNTATE